MNSSSNFRRKLTVEGRFKRVPKAIRLDEGLISSACRCLFVMALLDRDQNGHNLVGKRRGRNMIMGSRIGELRHESCRYLRVKLGPVGESHFARLARI